MEPGSSFLGPVCDRLISFAVEECALPRNLKEDVETLQSTAILVKAVLHDAEDKEAKGEAIRVWLRQLKQIFLDVEDILDEIATDALLHRGYGENHVIVCQIKAIMLKLDRISKQKNELGLQTSVPMEYRPTRPPTCSLLPVDGSYFSGRDEERDKMIKVLIGSEKEKVIESNIRTGGIQVLVIIGVGGVGKTTLAKLIYNDARVREHFELMMWVCVSEDFDLKRITKEIMEATLSFEDRNEPFEISNWDLHQRKLKDKIKDKRFLLVLDDMWEEETSKWETLCVPLVSGAKESKILVTTRKQEILNMVNGIPFPLEVMSSEALWPIFRRYAFGNEESSGKMQLEIVGGQIVKKLKGLPLAARVIGRLLNGSWDMTLWIDILNSEIFTLQGNDIGILPVLKLSYDHLSMNLKQCFAYCSLFPKDYIFSKDELILMWMAQNFIPNTRDLYAERVGRESCEDLLNKSLFEPDVKSSSNESFKMHDLIHDLAESVSRDDCLRLGDDKLKHQVSKNVRHISIATDSFDMSKLMEVLEVLNSENLRTLVFLHQNTFQRTLPLDDLFEKLKRLRILGLRRCKIEQVPSSIGKLKHLRFVDLSKTPIKSLPNSISNLRNLQVLKLKGCRMLRDLPENTSELVNLRHLQLDTEIASCVGGLRKLTALQELIITGSKVGELVDMSMLKELRIWGLEGIVNKEEAVHARLEAKQHLQLLKLKWGEYHWPCQRPISEEEEEVVDSLKPVNRIRRLSVKFYKGARSPNWMGDPSWVSTSLLETVELYGCTKWEDLPPLGQLPCLKLLRISRMSGVKMIGPKFFSYYDDDKAFPSLEELEFSDMPEWEKWESPVVEQQQQQQQQHPLSCLPRLRTLLLRNCPKLGELPPLPPTLTTLQLRNVGMTYLPRWMTGCCDGGGSSSRDVTPSLSSLEIRTCPNLASLNDWLLQRPLRMLKELGIYECKELASLPNGLFRHLPSLEHLQVSRCPKLSWPPSATTGGDTMPSTLKDIRLHGCGDTLARLGALTSLTSLGIIGDHNHVIDDGALSGYLRGLTSLKYISISGCSAITTLLPPLRLLSALEDLAIIDCAELSSLGCSAPISIGRLTIDRCPKLLRLVDGGREAGVTVSSSTSAAPSSSSSSVTPAKKTVPAAKKMSVKIMNTWSCSWEQIATWLHQLSSLQHLAVRHSPGDDVDGTLEGALLDLAPSLRVLHFTGCESLSSLPSQLRGLSCLEELSIIHCPKIGRLPSAGLPETLERVTIVGCPELEERCKEVGSPEWRLLSHVPSVRYQ